MKDKDSLKDFSGEWLLLFNEEIVDHSSNIEDVLKSCEQKFPSDKFPNDEIKITKVMSGKEWKY